MSGRVPIGGAAHLAHDRGLPVVRGGHIASDADAPVPVRDVI